MSGILGNRKIIKKFVYFATIVFLISNNSIAKDYSGLNYSITPNRVDINTRHHDSEGYAETSLTNTEYYDNRVLGFSWSAGYDKKWDSILPFDRALYTGLEIGGTYLTDDLSSEPVGVGDYVVETLFRGHHAVTGGLELGFNLGQGKVTFDTGAALANILNITWDIDGNIDFANSPHTQDTVPGYYLGFGFEHLYNQHWGFEFGVRYYNFSNMEESWTATDSVLSPNQFYKYENELTQVQFGLVFYPHK